MNAGRRVVWSTDKCKWPKSIFASGPLLRSARRLLERRRSGSARVTGNCEAIGGWPGRRAPLGILSQALAAAATGGESVSHTHYGWPTDCWGLPSARWLQSQGVRWIPSFESEESRRQSALFSRGLAMDDVTPHKDPGAKANLIGTIVVLVALTAGLIYFWPTLFGEVTVRELSEDLNAHHEKEQDVDFQRRRSG